MLRWVFRVVDHQDAEIPVGNDPADRHDDLIERPVIVLDDVVEHVLLEDALARVEVELAGEDDGRQVDLEGVVERLAMGRVGQVEVGHGNEEAVIGVGGSLPHFGQRTAGHDIDAQIGFETVFQGRGEHPRIFDKQDTQAFGCGRKTGAHPGVFFSL